MTSMTSTTLRLDLAYATNAHTVALVAKIDPSKTHRMLVCARCAWEVAA